MLKPNIIESEVIIMKIIQAIKESFRNVGYLFTVQLKMGVRGVIYQFLYSALNSFKSFFLILIPKIIIDFCVGFDSPNYFLISLFVFAAISWIVDTFIGITEVLQSIYNLKFAHFFKRKIAAKAMDMDYKNTESAEHLDLMEKALDSAYDLSGSQITDLLTYLLKLITLIYIMSTLDWGIALITVSVVVLIYFINKKASKINHKYDMEKSVSNRKKDYVEEQILDFGFAKDLRIFNGLDFLTEKYDSATDEYLSVQKKQNRFNFIMSLLKSALNAGLNGGIYIYLILKYSFGLVAVSSFTMYISAVAEFYNAIDAVFFMLIDFYTTNMNIREMNNFLEAENTIFTVDNGNVSVPEIREIEFKNVTFTYPGQVEPALKNISVKIKAGEKVMLVGENGAGKTTFVKLLMRLYDVDSGEILVNGINIKNIPFKTYIKLLEPVFQDVNMFAYTFRENIAFDNAERDDDSLLNNILFDCGLNSRFETFPDGLDTYYSKEFDENGVNLSGGEKQKLSISRAVFKRGQILILDEPNSALDAISERNLFTGISKLGDGKITIFISHRLSASKFCDKIYVFNNGQITESGSFSDLMRSTSVFHSLYNIQSDYYK